MAESLETTERNERPTFNIIENAQVASKVIQYRISKHQRLVELNQNQDGNKSKTGQKTQNTNLNQTSVNPMDRIQLSSNLNSQYQVPLSSIDQLNQHNFPNLNTTHTPYQIGLNPYTNINSNNVGGNINNDPYARINASSLHDGLNLNNIGTPNAHTQSSQPNLSGLSNVSGLHNRPDLSTINEFNGLTGVSALDGLTGESRRPQHHIENKDNTVPDHNTRI